MKDAILKAANQLLVEHSKLLELVKLWMLEAIRNQEQLKLENETFPFPEWNKGYLCCLEDLKGIIEENSK